jgi:CheY-like chemotaxis protein
MPPSGVLLLIDDEEPVRRTAQRMGQRLGIEVITATDGESGVELCRQHAAAITCAMIDLTMPGMNGIDCLKSLHTVLPALPAVLSSGFAAEQISERFGETGFSVFLQKPFSFDQFADAIRRATAKVEE